MCTDVQEKKGKLDINNIQNLSASKDISKKVKRQATRVRTKRLQNTYLREDLYVEYAENSCTSIKQLVQSKTDHRFI